MYILDTAQYRDNQEACSELMQLMHTVYEEN